MAQADPRDHMAETFAQLAVELYDAPGLADTAEAVLAFALHALNCSYAGLALAARRGHLEICAVTDPVVEALFQGQIDNGEGPVLQAIGGRVTVSVPDITNEARWPAWARQAQAAGICSVLHIPMITAASTVGVLSLFSTALHAFSDDDEAIAYLLAEHASVAVAHARKDETLARAVDARKIVGQAEGILMERFQVDGDRAFAILRRYSQDTNTKLRDVAQQLIDTRELPR